MNGLCLGGKKADYFYDILSPISITIENKVFDLKPEAERKLTYGYRIAWPADKKVTYGHTRK